jgi:hypothetical protein
MHALNVHKRNLFVQGWIKQQMRKVFCARGRRVHGGEKDPLLAIWASPNIYNLKKKCYLSFIFNNKGCTSSNVHVVCPLLLATCFSSVSLSWLNISQLRTVSLLGCS